MLVRFFYDLNFVTSYHVVRIEGSGFHRREPDENRWTIKQGSIDSWST
jgi:hypothetical protein